MEGPWVHGAPPENPWATFIPLNLHPQACFRFCSHCVLVIEKASPALAPMKFFFKISYFFLHTFSS